MADHQLIDPFRRDRHSGRAHPQRSQDTLGQQLFVGHASSGGQSVTEQPHGCTGVAHPTAGGAAQGLL